MYKINDWIRLKETETIKYIDPIRITNIYPGNLIEVALNSVSLTFLPDEVEPYIPLGGDLYYSRIDPINNILKYDPSAIICRSSDVELLQVVNIRKNSTCQKQPYGGCHVRK